MKRIIYFIITLAVLTSCEVSNNTQANSSYKILSEDVNEAASKSSIDIELPEKLSVEELLAIANELRESREMYDNLWICYYLPGMKVGSGAWATSHFTPDLNVEILGANKEEEAKMKANAEKVDGKILGKFYEEGIIPAAYTVYEKNNKTFLQILYNDGSSSNNNMKCKNLSTGIRLDYKDGESDGEYFILTKSGVLEFYGAEGGKFTEAVEIK